MTRRKCIIFLWIQKERSAGNRAPVIDGSRGSASLFTQMPSTGKGSPVEFTLNKVERIGDNGIYLNYLTRAVR